MNPIIEKKKRGAQLGHSVSKETRTKISNANTGKKGHVAWNKGKSGVQTHSSETKRKITLALTGRLVSEDSRKKMSLARLKNPVSFWKGKKFNKEHLNNLSKAKTGLSMPQFTFEHINNLRLARLGEKNAAWKGGITPLNKKIRNSKEYDDWRIKVFKRDNYTCVECGSRGVTLNADHIKPFAYYPDLRLVIENGRTLCVPCHRKTDTFAGRGFKKEHHKTNKITLI